MGGVDLKKHEIELTPGPESFRGRKVWARWLLPTSHPPSFYQNHSLRLAVASGREAIEVDA